MKTPHHSIDKDRDKKDFQRIGVFGGTFSPFHRGHLHCALSCVKDLCLDELRIVPAANSPGRPQIEGPSTEERMEMAKIAISDSNEAALQVDDREIRRGGESFTFLTLQEICQEEPGADLFLIIGSDQFEKFDHWFRFEEILKLAHLVVVYRPGYDLPEGIDQFPPGVRAHIKKFDRRSGVFHSGLSILFKSVEEGVDVSGKEIRRLLRVGESVTGMLPESVEKMIIERGWYKEVRHQVKDYRTFSLDVVKILEEKNAIRVVGFELGQHHHLADFAIVASGNNIRHTSAVVDDLIKKVKEKFLIWPQNVEGRSEGRWIVVDYGFLIVHVFYDFVRQEYRLEDLWKDKPTL